MKLKLILLFIFTLLLLGICCGPRILDWTRLPEVKSPEELLEPLTATQVQCIEQITDKNNITYVEVQEDNNFLGVGYVAPDGFYAAMLDATQNGNCHLEFQRMISGLQNPGGDTKEIIFLRVQRLELTGDGIPDIYVWRNQYKTGRRGSAKHIVYSKQADGSYEIVLLLSLCRDRSSVQIMESEGADRSRIIVTDDERCGRTPDEKKHIELVLNNQGHETIKIWKDE